MTKIFQSTILKGGDPHAILDDFLHAVNDSDFVCGHNITQFDIPFVNRVLRGYGLPEVCSPVIDTTYDILFPDDIRIRKLTYLAAEHGILNAGAHSALFDVLTTMALLKKYDIQETIERSKSKTVVLRAQTARDEGDLARKHGFYYNRDKKSWFRVIKECDLPLETPFNYIKSHDLGLFL